MNNKKYETAENYFSKSEYEAAFQLYKEVTEDLNSDIESKVHSFNMMGIIVSSFVPGMDIESDNGIEYFRKSIELDPDCVLCLYNILSTYGKHIYGHNDQQYFALAYKRLIGPLRSKLTDDQYEDILRMGKRYSLNL
jgi:tetratricopeptide (TPR) repeat protein